MRSQSLTSGRVLLVSGLTIFFVFEERSPDILAQQRDEAYVIGAGHAACRVWGEARARKSAAATVFSSWMQGYLTGAADGHVAMHERIRTGALDSGIAAARRRYCSVHPEDKELCRAIALASEPREILAAVSGSEVDSWLDKWCIDRPSDTLFHAAQALTRELDMVALDAAK